MRLITGPRRQTEGRARPVPPPPAGVYRPVKGAPMVGPDIGTGTSRARELRSGPPCP
jgi:hypothetical protein